MILVTLFCLMLIIPAAAVAAVWVVNPDDADLHDSVFTAAAIWYVGLFGVTGIIYIINTLTTISTYGK